MLSLSVNHPDVEEFVTKKQDLTKVTGANISVKVTDEFMKAVENDEDYILRFPVDKPVPKGLLVDEMPYNELWFFSEDEQSTSFFKKVRAKELWSTIIHCAWNTAEPGIIFETRMHEYSPDGIYDKFRMVSTNPCFHGKMKILTTQGYKTFEQLNNKEVRFIDSNGREVKGTVWCNGEKEIYEVVLWNKESILCTKDHHFMTADGKELPISECEGKRLMPYFTFNTDINDFTRLGYIFMEGDFSGLIDTKGQLVGDIQIQTWCNEDIADMFNVSRESPYYESHKYNTLCKILDIPTYAGRGLPPQFHKWELNNKASFLKGIFSAKALIIYNDIVLPLKSSNLLEDIKEVLDVNFNIESYVDNCNTPTLVISEPDSIRKFAKCIAFIQKEKNSLLEKSILETAPLVKELKRHSTDYVYDFNLEGNNHWGVVEGVIAHNCGEIPMGPYDSCRLMHMNLTGYIKDPFTPDAKIDFDLLYKHSYEAMRLADDLVDLELEAVDKIIEATKDDSAESGYLCNLKKTAEEGRRAGLGSPGRADAIAMLGVSYNSSDALCKVGDIMKTMFYAQLDCQVDMAIERGSFPAWDRDLEFKSTKSGHNKWYEILSICFPVGYGRMLEHGRRNLSWSTVAPTGTVSIMAQCSSGIEPVFMPFYQRKRKCMSPDDRADYVDKLGEKYTLFTVVHPNLKKWAVLNNYWNPKLVTDWNVDDWQEAFERSPYYKSTAPEIDWDLRVDIQSIVQRYITHSISSTINLPKETTEEKVSDIYMKAWGSGLKGITVYRDGCREGVLTQVDKPKTIEGRQAPKRPKDLEADCYLTKARGEQFIVLVGLLDDKPYEIWAFRPKNPVNFKTHKGVITKIGKMHYRFKSDFLQIENLESANIDTEEDAATLYSSMLLRHGVDIGYIIKTAKKVNDNIVSFSSAMCRILAKYIPEREVRGEVCPDCGSTLYQEGGCTVCKNCGYGKCG